MSNGFEPKIIAFLCNWCSYAGADAAGNQQKNIPANIKVIRVMCSGRIEPEFIFKSFLEGADGVLVLGCHLGDCHYKEGNYLALRRVTLVQKMLKEFGIDEQRVEIGWVSASEGENYSRITNEMTERIRALGPYSGVQKQEENNG